MKFIIKDMNDNIHEACPRCGKEWNYLTRTTYTPALPEHLSCTDYDNCKMMACLNNRFTKEYFLAVKLDDNYTLYWDTASCMLSTSNLDTRMAILPFDITIERVKIFLPFI